MTAPGLIDVLKSLPAARGAYSARGRVGTAPEAALRLDAPSPAVLEAWLAAERARAPGGDDRLAAAYLLGSVAFSVSEILAALVLRGVLPGVLPGAAVVARRARWEKNGESGEGIAYDMVFADGALVACPDPAAGFGAALIALFAPLVAALQPRSGLSRGALWRLVGDGLSAALLARGKETGREEAAMGIASAILRDRASPLQSRQTGFVEVSAPGRPGIREWFRVRGGCCRYYTSAGGEYCTTCVLRDEESRRARLEEYLRRKHGLAA
ncbi:(2Fe-2S)-binding protein [Wenxinia saemankumensis]|uniref:FhuF 2Fe-2S C-terminal domain-containing protein n=1 Tax=Wenxinia saemankumensis TaxID=1447782 RepID=A0A1M6FN96_9RHOB|nr:(2Fe-2S)-binding protein [Wenxinia saemankumensis]SHI99144.1 FhuF 2Fe-2S C-terminal domain-containing protein [Wenxinia saemankumensis]